jgi:hypothetical protein
MATSSAAQTPSEVQSGDQAADRETFHVDLTDGTAPPQGFIRGRTVVLVCAALVVGLLGLNLFSTLAGNRRDERRLDDLATLRSDKTSHTFETTNEGLIERYVADPVNPEVEASIRRAAEELLLIRRNVGDFSVGEQKNLVGRETLESGVEKMTITEASIPGGAELRYMTKDPELLEALRTWSASQEG